MAEIVDGVDRISELPLHIIHHIFRRIRQDNLDNLKVEAQTCLLSKRWNLIWRTRPDVIVCQRRRRRCYWRSTEDFVKLVDNCLRPHVEQNLRIETLSLQDLNNSEELSSHVDRWLSLAIKLDVSFLEITALGFSLYYSIPESIYAAKKLTVLHLCGCNLELDSTTNKLQRLISMCTLIRDLNLDRCKGLRTLHVFGLVNLEKLKLIECEGLEKVEIQAPNLREFVYVGNVLLKYQLTGEPLLLPCTIDILDGHKTLKILNLKDTTMTNEQFGYQLSKFSALEELHLQGCYLIRNINVASEKLKKFSLDQWMDLEQVNMLASKLMAFDYLGYKMPFSITTMDPFSLEQAKLHFCMRCQSYSRNLLEFVQKFNYSKGLILVIKYDKSILIYEDPRDIVLPPAGGRLLLRIENPSVHLINDLMMPYEEAQIIFVVPCSNSKILQVFHETPRVSTKYRCGRLNEFINQHGRRLNGKMFSWLKSTSLIDRITTFMFKY